MKILLLTNRDIASCLAANRLISGLKEHDWRIFTSERVGKAGKKPAPLAHLSFIEQTLFFNILFPALARTQSRSAKLSTFDDFVSQGIPVSPVTAVNGPECLQEVAAWQPDICLSIRFGQILKADFIRLAKHGVLNLHSGILPDYRGVMATFWAMLNEESHIGTSLHWIPDATIDTGDILKIDSCPVDYSRSYFWNMMQLYRAGITSLQTSVSHIALGQMPESTSPAGKGQYFTYPTDSELQAFSNKGLRLYDPDEIVELAHQFIS